MSSISSGISVMLNATLSNVKMCRIISFLINKSVVRVLAIPTTLTLKGVPAMIFIKNKYTKCYFNIITRAKSRTLSEDVYTEKHHIIPKSLDGSNNKSNLAILTAREHFICHLLLPKMVTGVYKRNMTFALWSMLTRDHSKNKSRYKLNSHQYQKLKEQFALAMSELHKGKIVSAKTKSKMRKARLGKTSPNKGKAMSESQKQKISIAHKGKIVSPATVAKILATRQGYTHSAETKQKIKESNLGKHTNRNKLPCPHCDRLIATCGLKHHINSHN
jgi:hypothetical protein